jgi:ATP-dependent helicase/DNAse subunit B
VQIIIEAEKEPESFRTKAADFGTIAHDIIERLIKAPDPEEVDCEPQYEQIKQNFLQWKRHTPWKLIKTEIEVYSMKYEYAGKR